jgi:hypothetical protein
MRNKLTCAIWVVCTCYLCVSTRLAADPENPGRKMAHQETHQESPLNTAPPMELVGIFDGVTPGF